MVPIKVIMQQVGLQYEALPQYNFYKAMGARQDAGCMFQMHVGPFLNLPHRVGEVYNIGSSVEMSVVDLAQQIRKIVSDMTGQENEYEIVHIPDRPYSDQCNHMDTTKVKEDLSWKESVSFKDGLKDTVTWYLTTQPTLPQD